MVSVVILSLLKTPPPKQSRKSTHLKAGRRQHLHRLNMTLLLFSFVSPVLGTVTSNRMCPLWVNRSADCPFRHVWTVAISSPQSHKAQSSIRVHDVWKLLRPNGKIQVAIVLRANFPLFCLSTFLLHFPALQNFYFSVSLVYLKTICCTIYFFQHYPYIHKTSISG